MKLNVTQANILAHEVVDEIKKSKKNSADLEKKIKVFLDKYDKDTKVIKDLAQKKEHLEQERSKFIKGFYKQFGIEKSYMYSSDNKFTLVLEEIKNKSVPTVKEIYNKIVMKSLFKTENDMEQFIKSLVEQYSK